MDVDRVRIPEVDSDEWRVTCEGGMEI